MVAKFSPRALLSQLEARAPRPLSAAELRRFLNLGPESEQELRAYLDAEVRAGRLRRVGKGRYQWIGARSESRTAAGASTAGHEVTGRYCRVRAGYGFVEVAAEAGARAPARDILIPEGLEGPAWHGDTVAVEIVRRDARARRLVGRVTRVLERGREQVVGTLQWARGRWRVVPEDDLLPVVELAGDRVPRPPDVGKIALARLVRAAGGRAGATGELERVLGDAEELEVQFFSIAVEHGLRTEFPPAAVREAQALPSDPSPAEMLGRKDLRDLPFVTIDGEAARDFDDAVCLAVEGSGYRLWVAIADVAFYVRPGSALDREAAARGTSVYFPDRAIPMLPAALSEGLCSLGPHRERLVQVVELRYDRHGRRREVAMYPGVIRSRARLTYTKVAAVLSQADTAEIRAWRAELGPLLPQLRAMEQFMRLLLRNRMAAGSLDLDLPEALVDLSEEGRSIGVRLVHRNDAHRIIEEFMLEANRAVAEYFSAQGVPIPYRVHEAPEPDAIEELNRFLRAFGFEVRYHREIRPGDLQRLLSEIEGHRMERVLSRLVLRSLKQARYSVENLGHFGLAFPVYCHFTSPIRRYPDLLVHRQLQRLREGRREEAESERAALEAACAASSEREREAMEAERAMLDLKKAEFMLDHLLEPEPGTIVSVISSGCFVELDAYPVEGFLRAEDLPGDRYRYVERENALRGLRTGRRLRLGDRVLVEATNVSLARRQVDFALLKVLSPADRPPRAGLPEAPRR